MRGVTSQDFFRAETDESKFFAPLYEKGEGLTCRDVINQIAAAPQKEAVRNYCDDDGNNLLMFAVTHCCDEENIEIIELYKTLRNIRWDFDAKGSDGETAFHSVAKRSHPVSVKHCEILFALQAEFSSQTYDGGCTALHFAAMHKNWDVLTKLIEFGADMNAPNNAGQTPLHWAACENGNIYKMMIDCGADPEAPDYAGNTPHAFNAQRLRGELDNDSPLILESPVSIESPNASRVATPVYRRR